MDQNFAYLIPVQGTCLGCRFGPQSERIKRAVDRCFYLSFSLPLSLDLKTKIKTTKINKSLSAPGYQEAIAITIYTDPISERQNIKQILAGLRGDTDGIWTRNKASMPPLASSIQHSNGSFSRAIRQEKEIKGI